MSRRPALLFWCQHSLGLGHLTRAFALCAELSRRFRVVLLSGGPVPGGMEAPAGVEVVALPPLGIGPGGTLVSRDPGVTLDEAAGRRGRRVLEAFHAIRPEVLVVEQFPFGRKKFAAELIPLLESARAAARPPLVLCSVRDVLVSRGADQEAHDERACGIANEYFDAVLVHGDPRFARLEESLDPGSRLRVPVHHTGFVAGPPPVAVDGGRGRVVVSAGGGLVGAALLRAAVEAQRLLDTEMLIVAGPFLPEESWLSLQARADGVPGLELRRSVPDLGAELAGASASVSQCGYNTALDLLRSRVPALVVPFEEEGEDEQARRARRLADLGALRVLEPARLGGAALAREIRALRDFRPSGAPLDLDGARATARLVGRLSAGRAVPPLRGEDWLEPLGAALDDAPGPVTFFFRDDDAGWHDAALHRLLQLFADRSLPLDLAVIPSELHPGLARALLEHAESAPLGLHQHGFAHVNHEADGRSCEFGPSRPAARQRRDIAEGMERLRGLLGPAAQPIFSPPWNRCTRVTGECLVELGFTALSRDASAVPLDIGGLLELPVSVDWHRRRRGRELTRAEVVAELAGRVGGGGPLGVMFHHALMGPGSLAHAAAALDLLAGHPNAACRPMWTLLEERVPAGR